MPVVRNDFLEGIDGGADTFAAILDPVSAAHHHRGILTELGARIAIDQEDVDAVAADFLASLPADGSAASMAPAESMAATE